MIKANILCKKSTETTKIYNHTKRAFFLYRFFILLIVLFAGLLAFNIPVKAQDNLTGRFSGEVFDKNGTRIPNATISFIYKDTGVPVANIRTDSEGRYTRTALPAGVYIVQASISGYKTRTIEFTLFATEKIQIIPPFYLESESVAVTTQPVPNPSVTPLPPVPPPSGDGETGLNLEARRGGAFSNKEVENLPAGSSTFVRSFDEFALLVPGVAPPPQAIGNSVGPGVGPGVGTSGQFSVNGLRSRANNFMVDGSDNNDEDIGVRRQGFFSLIPQPIESVQEFTIITLLAPAQFGRNLGAQVNVLSKSGGKDFHGSLYAFFNSDRLNARNFFDFVGETPSFNLQGRRRDGSSVNVLLNGRTETIVNPAGDEDSLTFLQGGGTLGGPIVRNKMFFYVSAEGQFLDAEKETNFAVPTVEQRGFLGRGAEGIGISGDEIIESFPTTVLGSYVLGLYPFPNDPNGLYGRNTYTRLLPADAQGRVISGKFDYNFGSSERRQFFTARYNYTDDWRDIQKVGGAIFASVRPLTRTDNFSAFVSGELRNNLSNVFRFSWGRSRLRFDENPYNEGYLQPINRGLSNEESRFLLNGLGLVNQTSPTCNETACTPATNVRFSPNSNTIENVLGPVGQVNISGFSPLGVDVLNFPQQRVNNTFQLADSVFLTAGSHNIAFGVDIRRTYLQSDLPRNSRLAITSTGAFRGAPFISQIPTAFTNEIPQIISPIDIIAAGSATGIFQSLVLPGRDAEINLSFNQINLFVQNDQRVSSNLTFSYGLRYELNTVPKEADRKIEDSFQADPGNSSQIRGLNDFIAGREKIYDLDTNNFAPRFGFAYAPDQKVVIRGGYGIYYDQILGAVVSQSRNVFPTFTTVNFGTVSNGALIGIRTPYNFNFPIIQNGTLNTLNSTQTQQDLINFFAANAARFPTPFGATLPQKELSIPLSHQYSVSVEHQFASNAFFSVAYVGTVGRNLLRFSTPNLGRNNVITINDLNFDGLQPNLLGRNDSPKRGRPNTFIGPIDQFETTGRSRYDSLQLQLRGRLARSFQYQIAYTFAKAKDDVSDVFDLAGASALPQNSLSFAGEYAPANFDVRHRFTYNFIYDLPTLDDDSKVLKFLFGGWQLSGTGKFNTGQPFTVNTIFDVNQDGNLTDRLNNVQGITVGGSRRQPVSIASGQTNLRSFLAPVGQDGSVLRNSFRAGNLLELDLSFNKRFPIYEGQSLVLRFDVFNFINRANFGIPIRFLEFPGFGQAVETVTPGRRIQIALKYIF